MTHEQLTELYATMRALHDKLYALEFVRADQCKVGDTLIFWAKPKRVTQVTENSTTVEDMLTGRKDKWDRGYSAPLVRFCTTEDAQSIVDNVKAWILYGGSTGVDEFVTFWNQETADADRV